MKTVIGDVLLVQERGVLSVYRLPPKVTPVYVLLNDRFLDHHNIVAPDPLWTPPEPRFKGTFKPLDK